MTAPTPPPAQPAPTSAAPGTFVDPYRSYNFRLLVPGLAEAAFTECSGIGATITALRYRQGGGQQVEHRIPGRVRYNDITLRYGLTQSRQLWDWFNGGLVGQVRRLGVSIVVLDADDVTERVRWDLDNAWPKEWRGAKLDGMSDEIAIETLTLVYESVQRV